MYRSRRCFIPECKSGYKTCPNKFSLFIAPKDETERKKWQMIIARPDKILSERDVVCAKHFNESDIIRGITISDIYSLYKKPGLKKGALPRHFLNNENTSILNEMYPEYLEPIVITPSEPLQSSHDLDLINIFDELSQLPNWGVFHVDDKIILSQMSVMNNDSICIPVMRRQVILNNNFNIEFFNGQNKIDTNKLNINKNFQNGKDVRNIILKFEKVCICDGVKLNLIANESETDYHYKDHSSGVWRHKNCDFLAIDKRHACKYCLTLQRNNICILTKNKKRKRKKLNLLLT